MADTPSIDQLRQEFSHELTESVIKDVASVHNDLRQARHALLNLVSKEPTPEVMQRYLRELDNFQLLGQEVIMKMLADNKWDVEKTIVMLVPMMEEKQRAELRKNREKERQEIIKREREKASAYLKSISPTIPQEKINQMLEENDGDVNATVEMIINMEDERQRKEREEERIRLDRTEKCHAVAIRFNKSPQEVEQLLNEQNWDINKVVNQLVKAEQDIKYQRIIQLYNYRRPEEIRHALENNNYDEIKTIKFIDDKIERETQEAERRAKEQKERREAERKRSEEMQKQQIEELKRLHQQKEREEQMRLLEEKNARAREEAERLRSENERQEREAHLAKEKEEEAKTMAALHEALLQRSVVVVDQIQQQISELNPHNVLKNALETRLREVAGPTFTPVNYDEHKRNDLPSPAPDLLRPFGERPPLPHLVDDPVTTLSPTHTTSTSSTSTSTSTPTSTSSTSTSHTPQDLNVVRLEVHPLRVDYGETITVTWEYSDQPANSSNWIAMYREGAQNKDYESKKYEWAPTQKGSITFTAPQYTGRFFFRFLFNRTYICWGTSNFVEVGPTFKITPSLSQNQVTIKVDQTTGQPCPSAWVAMYEPNKPHTSYYNYFYLPSAPPTQVSFKIPKVGVWEFRLFPQRSYFVADTCQVEFKGNDTLSTEVDTTSNQVIITHNILSVDPCYDNVWVGIYHTSETDIRQYRRFGYVKSDSGKVMLKAIQTPGTYEARLFARGSPDIITRSNSIVVTPKNK